MNNTKLFIVGYSLYIYITEENSSKYIAQQKHQKRGTCNEMISLVLSDMSASGRKN